jgi:hypothetical protein
MAYFNALVRNLRGGIQRIHENHVRVAVLGQRFEHGVSGICISNVKHLIAAFRCGLKKAREYKSRIISVD